ncbi:MAG: hypothetical protein KME55_02035 [Nostoc indistinguendum CM1-VF10]|jgi:hypothetical protein|nr:hypothetical protein [Nostoc indistinguendum CM1-VF10]
MAKIPLAGDSSGVYFCVLAIAGLKARDHRLMNELDVIVKLYEKCLHKASLDLLPLVCKAILLIRTSVKKFTPINNWLQCQARL